MPPSCEITSRRRSARRGPWSRPMPCQAGQEPGQRLRLDRLDGAAQARQRAPADAPQHVGRDPLAAAPPGRNAPSSSSPSAASSRQRRAGVDAQPLAQLLRRERPVRAGVPRHQPPQRVRRPAPGTRAGSPGRDRRRRARRGRGRRPRRRSAARRPAIRTATARRSRISCVGRAPGRQLGATGRPAGAAGRACWSAVSGGPRRWSSRLDLADRVGVQQLAQVAGGAAARRAAPGRAAAPARGARPAARRPRTCRSRCSRRAASDGERRRHAPTRPRPAAPRRGRSPASRPRSAGTSKTSDSTSR